MAATDTTTDPRAMDPVEVQHILDNLHGNMFKVIFLTKTGEQRMYEGTLFDSNTRKDDIPFKETFREAESGSYAASGKVKSFNINRVLYLGVI